MADVEREIENKAREEARQAGKMPTIVLVDISRTGWSWMRGPQAMIPALQKILPSTPFAGLGVFTTSLDNPEPMQRRKFSSGLCRQDGRDHRPC